MSHDAESGTVTAADGLAVSGGRPRPGHLTLTDTLAGYACYAGVGYLVAGWTGAGCGAALLTSLFARQVWHASRVRGGGGTTRPDAESFSWTTDSRSDDDPGADSSTV